MAKTTFIMPGFAEGTWHTRILQKSLDKLGYREAENAAVADIVITHSAGCFFLPNTPDNTRIILINPPYWPGRPLIVSTARKVWGDFSTAVQRRKLGFWARKTVRNWLYIALNLLRVVQIGRFARRRNFHEALADKNVAIIRNDNDPWFTPDATKTLPKSQTFTFYRLPGEHEDCWVYPDEHAALIHKILQSKQ